MDWRDHRIRTLAELETRTQDAAKEWLASTKGSDAVRMRCTDWLNLVQADLGSSVGRLCQEYQLPASALALDITPDVSGVSAKNLPGIDDPANLTEISQGIMALVIASILGGGGMALLLHGPVGWIIGLAVGVAVMVVGQDATKDTIKQMNIPGLVRGLILGNEAIESKCKEMIPELGATLAKDLAANDQIFRDLAEGIRAQVQDSLRARAEEAVILIR